MPISRNLQAKRTLFERLGWDVAERDDNQVAQAIANQEELDAIHNLDQAGLLDAFMVARGYGKGRTTEYLETEVIGIERLAFWDTYNDPKQVKNCRKRGYRPKPINAVVVRKWDNHDEGPGGKVVFLTNQPVTNNPLSVFDDYDGRSLIENTLFREGKQGWALESIPQKTQRAAVAHVFITFAVIALTTAYREWMRQEEEEEEKAQASRWSRVSLTQQTDEPLGVRRWRRELFQKTKDYVIVFSGNNYGIYQIAEFTILTGHRLKNPPEEIGTPQEVFKRYGLQPPPS